MLFSFKISKQLNIASHLILLVTFVTLVFGLNSCSENSSKLVNKSQPIRSFKVNELIAEEFGFNKSQFIEDVIQVEGIVKDFNYLNNRHTIILRGKEDIDTLIICDMQNSQGTLIKSLKRGDIITLKGILKGSLKDVILLHCVISNRI